MRVEILSGADALVCAGPPGPASGRCLDDKTEVPEPTRASAADEGVRPTWHLVHGANREPGGTALFCSLPLPRYDELGGV